MDRSPHSVRVLSLCQMVRPVIPYVSDMELTDSTTTDFLMVGNSRAVANMSIGQITLDPIKVNVSTSLSGLQGLKGYTTIGTVDVMGGTQQALNLSIDGKLAPQLLPFIADSNQCPSIILPISIWLLGTCVSPVS